MSVTATDGFCGGGGSSLGMALAGVKVRNAINHWDLAIETHSTNHPNTDHYLDDLQEAHPSRYPRTDILWMSPECTSHSIAKGRQRKNINQLDLWGQNRVDPAEERSRATMREVVEFTAFHRYEYVIVENVVDIRNWQHYQTWWNAMLDLGYDGRVLYLNSQFFGVPQSRDRYYAVFTKKGNKIPNLDFHPVAWCAHCEAQVESVQVFKKYPAWGRYGAKRQYTYRCPTCGTDVYPTVTPAASVIDWTNLGTQIGGRKTPLKPKTLERIRAGLRKFARPLVVDTLFTHSNTERATPVTQPLRTLTSRQSMGLACPPFLMSYYGRDDAQSSVDAPLPVIPTEPRHGIVVPPMLLNYVNNDLGPRSVDDPLLTIAGSHTPPLIVPPFLTGFYSSGISATGTDEPIPTITGTPHHGLVSFLSSYYGHEQSSAISAPMNTITGKDRHALITVNLKDEDVEEMLYHSKFRMLTPAELQKGMSFPEDYIILGSNKDKVKQIGNAVCPYNAYAIAERVLEAYAAS